MKTTTIPHQTQIILASDHAGFALKEAVKKFLQDQNTDAGPNFSILDVGAHELVDGDDYPTYMAAAALKVAEDLTGATKAIIFGGSGQGEAIVANRFPGVRAAVWYGGNEEIVELSRKHNDSNVLSLGARFIDEKTALHIVELWLTTEFSGEERHKRRIAQIDAIE
jgi:ribose 5-phosphate isomerase B